MPVELQQRRRGRWRTAIAWGVGLVAVAAALRGLPGYGPSVVWWAVAYRYPDQPGVTTAELARWLAGPAPTRPRLLDARTAEEFAVSHLRGAQRLSGSPEDSAGSGTDERPTVVYCSLGVRSAVAVSALRAAGAPRVYNLRGGIFQWANEGRPVFRTGRPALVVHPYDSLTGWLLEPAVRPRGQ